MKDYFLSGENFSLFQCSQCEFVFTQDHPGKEIISSYYKSEEYVSHSNTRDGIVNKLYHFSRGYMLGRKRKLIERLTHKKTRNILDIGSGTGFFLNHMREHGWDVTGIEPSEEGRKFCRDQFALEIQDEKTLFTLDKESYDVITLWHVLEHIQDIDEYMKKIHSMLRKDGLLLIALPNLRSTDAIIYKEKWAAYDVPRHLWHFTPFSFKKLAAKYQFQLLKMKSMPLDAGYVSLLSEKYRNNLLGFLAGGIIGVISLVLGLIDVKKSSSIIYILRKF
ncbi:MAG: class I SAM-dependent methyltransferase [Bacteroidota bacterium]|nr:class I SAM-dependent methyltransferase [Bacteroidota bacterium]